MTNSWKNRVTAAVATLAIAASMLPVNAFAADEDPVAEPEAPAASTTLTADTTITVTGIDSGDTAAYYQVIQQNATTKAWELTAAFQSINVTTTSKNKAINDALADDKKKTSLDFILDGIDAEEAGIIAANPGTKTGDLAENPSGTFSKAVEPGLYLVLITPAAGNKDVLYKPVFVAADYDQTTASPATIDAETAELDTAVAKKSPLTLEKEAKQINDGADTDAKGVAIGDTVEFTVKTNVPSYTTNYTNPEFKLTDELTTGLKLTGVNDIKVEVANNTVVKGTDYEITDVSDTGYTISFKPDFLYKVTGGPQLTVTYKATIESEAAQQVNEMDNTVTLQFSNNPQNASSKGELTDKTRHYTFDIDGNVFGGGSDSGKTKEVEKVGVDGSGNVIESITYTDYPTELPTGERPLGNAKFQLRTTANDASTALKFDANGKLSADGNDYVLSGSDGSITMKGLDEGTYYLVETEAPAGYSFDPTAKSVTIKAKYVPDADGNDVLESYTVTIGEKTSTYNAKKETIGEGEEAKQYPIELTNQGADLTAETSNTTTLIVNKKLGILPSTGGSGIYFYLGVGGAIAAGSAYLIHRTKKQEELLAK